jgi:SPP1 family predicted phage head-tail adaptor
MSACVKTIRLGDLRERITIQHEQNTPDGGGGEYKNWVDLVSVSAAVKPLRGTEEERGGQRGVRVMRFIIRRRGDVTYDMKIIWDGRDHNISDIRDPGPRASFMEIIGKTGVTQ